MVHMATGDTYAPSSKASTCVMIMDLRDAKDIELTFRQHIGQEFSNLGTVMQEKSTRKKLCDLLVCILHANLSCALTAM